MVRTLLYLDCVMCTGGGGRRVESGARPCGGPGTVSVDKIRYKTYTDLYSVYSVKSTQESSKTKRLLGLNTRIAFGPSSVIDGRMAEEGREAFEFCDARRPRTSPHSGSQHTHTHALYIHAQPHKTHESRFDTITALPVPQPQRLAPPFESPSMLQASPCTPPHPSQYLPNIRSGSPATEPAATGVGG